MEEISVDFMSPLGPPTYRGSGFIYGLFADGTQPEQALQSEIKVQFIRVGGAQLGFPVGGYVNGRYLERWNAVKAYYARAKAIGAKLILLPHDLWGADAVCNVPRWPGDNGDWTEFTQFLTQVIADVKAAGMTGPDVQWDIWNEPDLLTPVIFWGREQEQYLEMWKRAYRQIRAEIPDTVIVGPSTAGQPSSPSGWFIRYLNFIKANRVIPDYLSWHQLVPDSDPQTSKDDLVKMLSERGISVQGFQVNEYGANTCEQQAGPSAWYLGRFERTQTDALRANWGMGGGLYKGMGDLVTEGNQPMSSWWVYRRYAEMSGVLVALNPGKGVDGVASLDMNTQQGIILLGSRVGITGDVSVNLQNIPPEFLRDGKTNIRIERMPEGSGSLYEPELVFDQQMVVSGNSLSLPFLWNSSYEAYVIFISP
jgi:hypothetical protein